MPQAHGWNRKSTPASAGSVLRAAGCSRPSRAAIRTSNCRSPLDGQSQSHDVAGERFDRHVADQAQRPEVADQRRVGRDVPHAADADAQAGRRAGRGRRVVRGQRVRREVDAVLDRAACLGRLARMRELPGEPRGAGHSAQRRACAGPARTPGDRQAAPGRRALDLGTVRPGRGDDGHWTLAGPQRQSGLLQQLLDGSRRRIRLSASGPRSSHTAARSGPDRLRRRCDWSRRHGDRTP